MEQIYSPDEMGDFGIFCEFSRRRGTGMIYEIEIPLNQSEKKPYPARLSPKDIVSIGFITEKMAGERRRDKGEKGRRGRDGGGPPGGGGMGSGLPGGGMGGGGWGGGPPMGGGAGHGHGTRGRIYGWPTG